MKPLLLVLALGVALPAVPALAQSQVKHAQVYRCGPDGRDLRDSPCPGGNAASGVDYDQPSAADSRATRDRQMADAKQAAALAAARRASDAEARHQRAQTLGLQAQPAPAASAPQVVHLKPPKVARPHKPKAAASATR